MALIGYLHGFASSPASAKAAYFARLLGDGGASVEVPALDGGDFEHLTITGQLARIQLIFSGRRTALIGSSLGGYLAALYASTHPEVERLVLLAPAFGFERRWRQRLGPEAMERWRREGTIEVFHYGEKRHRPLAYGLLDDAARYPDCPDFQQPALIFHGAHDDIVPPDFSREFAASHRNVELEVVNSGHELLDVLTEIGTKVRQFLLNT